MNDMSAEMEERYRGLLMRRTGEERLIMGCAMRDTARAFVEASQREKNPEAMVCGHSPRPVPALVRTRT